MCGGNQTVTQKTELDPHLQRLLYGGSVQGGSYRPWSGGQSGGGQSGGSLSGLVSRPMTQPGPSAGGSAQYSMGGPVQGGIASMQPNMPMAQGVPMVNGMLPNLSNPELAATLAMAQMRPQRLAARGMPQQGFRGGGYVEGPGTGTSDSIPAQIYQGGVPVQEARLSDGEFVWTEEAVRGVGGGDRDEGAARMYQMMRQFERGGRV